MPPLTRWFIRSSLVFLILALAVSILLAGRRLVDLPEVMTYLGPVQTHLFVVGWVTQLIFGVAYWMFPKFSKERPRGSEGLAWATFATLNAGLILRVLAEPLNARSPGGAWSWLLAAAAILQWLAGMAFVANTWSRVKER